MNEILYMPYLPLRNRRSVGPWELIPWGQLEERECVSHEVWQAAQAILAAHTRKLRGTAGVLARAKDGMVGDPIDQSLMRVVQDATLLGSLETTTSPEEAGWGADNVVTSDNALIFGWRLGGEGWFAFETGAIKPRTESGLRLDDLADRLSPPIEVDVPLMWSGFQDDYADAAYGVLSSATPVSRRIARAAEWLDLAWRNTESISYDTRLLALFAGFEVLLTPDGADANSARLRGWLEDLIAGSDPRIQRTWTDRHGRERQEDLTEIGWWFVAFAELRNAIAHGDDVTKADREWEGTAHWHVAEQALRLAIKHVIAGEVGKPELLESPLYRAISRGLREVEEEQDDRPASH